MMLLFVGNVFCGKGMMLLFVGNVFCGKGTMLNWLFVGNVFWGSGPLIYSLVTVFYRPVLKFFLNFGKIFLKKS